MNDLLDLKLMITGPTFLRPEVKAAATLPEFGHRDSENNKRFAPIFENLKKMAQVDDNYVVALINGSGSYAMESTIRSLISDDDKVLNVSIGAFGDLYHKMAVLNGKNAVQLKFEPGKAIDLDKLEETLKAEKPNVVTFTHNETSTGVENDVEAVCKLIHKYNAISLVDGVSIFGGAPSKIMESKPMVYSTSTQKSIATPAGLGILFVNKDAIKKIESVKNRGYTSDLLAHINKAKVFQTLTTPNTTIANQLLIQTNYIINDEGIENRFNRHTEMQQMVMEWIDTLPNGFKKFAQDGFESPTVSTIEIPNSVDGKAIKEAMRKRGFLMDPGYGKLNKALAAANKNKVIRIGHMGDITTEMLADYLAQLKEELTK